jgi:hypothetical protein
LNGVDPPPIGGRIQYEGVVSIWMVRQGVSATKQMPRRSCKPDLPLPCFLPINAPRLPAMVS